MFGTQTELLSRRSRFFISVILFVVAISAGSLAVHQLLVSRQLPLFGDAEGSSRGNLREATSRGSTLPLHESAAADLHKHAAEAWDNSRWPVGTPVADFQLPRVRSAETIRLSELHQRKPVVLILGGFT